MGASEPKALSLPPPPPKPVAEPKALRLPEPTTQPSKPVLGRFQGKAVVAYKYAAAQDVIQVEFADGSLLDLPRAYADQLMEALQMPEPKPLALNTKPPERPTREKLPIYGEPRGLNFNSPAPSPDAPRGLALPTAPAPTPDSERSHLVQQYMAQVVAPRRTVESRPSTGAPSTRTIGDPRAPALVEKAKAKDAEIANDVRFRTRLEQFLKLDTNGWLTWGEKAVGSLTPGAQKHNQHSQKLTAANADQWARECEHAYSRPPGFLDSFARKKPEFYRVRLEQARDLLRDLKVSIDANLHVLAPLLKDIRMDMLVMEVATTDVTEASAQIIAGQRLGNLLAGLQTATILIQSERDLATLVATQAGAVNDRLTITIPNWLIAMSKA